MEVRHRQKRFPIITDPEKSARQAGLHYVTDDSPGLHRIKTGQGFRYVNEKGKRIRDKNALRRIQSLAIPPAWTGVWICPNENGHLQATGRDARGRKQYRYHPRWRDARDETKFTRMILFGEALPKIRRRLEKDHSLPGLPRPKVLSTIVRLLDLCYIRVGNDEYARQNKSFGLTTLRDHHAKINGSEIRLQFRGKRAKEHIIQVEDKRLAQIVKRSRDLPGQELFQYLDPNGQVQDIKSDDVNAYLREASGQDFTAKDFRTWAGTVLAARVLADCAEAKTNKEKKQHIVRAVEIVAHKLGNTPAICRKCYVHPAVFKSYHDGEIVEMMNGQKKTQAKLVPKTGLSSEEKCVLALLKKRLADEKEPLESKLQRSIARNAAARK